MTIEYKHADITTATSGIIAHGVNCQGAMGSGVAGVLRRKWPEIYAPYAKVVAEMDTLMHPRSELLGLVLFADIESNPNIKVAHCFTQEYFGGDGRVYADIYSVKEVLEILVLESVATGETIHLPHIASGLAGLDWERDVHPLLLQAVEEQPTAKVIVYSWP